MTGSDMPGDTAGNKMSDGGAPGEGTRGAGMPDGGQQMEGGMFDENGGLQMEDGMSGQDGGPGMNGGQAAQGEMQTPPEKPSEDDDGTKYPRPEGQNGAPQMNSGAQTPEMPAPENQEAAENQTDAADLEKSTEAGQTSEEKTVKTSASDRKQAPPEKPSEDDNGFKYPKKVQVCVGGSLIKAVQ